MYELFVKCLIDLTYFCNSLLIYALSKELFDIIRVLKNLKNIVKERSINKL
jgi:hypothetical protein